jgi:hypothetical protein
MKDGRLKVVRELEVYEMVGPADVSNYTEAYQKPSYQNDGSLSR